MEDRIKTKILELLANGPEDAGGLSWKLGISRNTLFSLLMRMEKEDLIAWNGREWTIAQSSDPGRSDT